MNELYNSIALRYKQSVVLTPSPSSAVRIPDRFIQALLTEIAQLGYTLDGDATNALKTLSTEDFLALRTQLIDELTLMIGAHVKYRPLFKNFPDDIPDDDEYFFKRIVGYIDNMFALYPEEVKPLSCGHVIDTTLFNMDDFGACPICQMQVDETTEAVRPPLEELTPLKAIGVVSKNDIFQIFKNLVGAKRSISENNKQLVTSLIQQDQASLVRYLPDAIPMKENLALVAGAFIKYCPTAKSVLPTLFRTATDILRLATYLSGGDISLKDHTRFKLSNPERRIIMTLLNEVNNPEPDMIRYRMRWIRLGEVLHVGSKRTKYPNTAHAFDMIRNHANDIETYGSLVEAYVHTIRKNPNDLGAQKFLIASLRNRPGEFARRLDWLLTHISDTAGVIQRFQGLVAELSTPMLLQLLAHLRSRVAVQDFRYFMPKGNMSKIQVTADTRPALDNGTVNVLCDSIGEEMMARFAKLPRFKNVYIDTNLSNYTLPMQQRSASNSLVPITRGSRVSLPEAEVARLFLYWKQNAESGRVDVDLSAVTYNENWQKLDHLSYTALSSVGGKHSGDIQSAPNGAAEFIDVNIEKCKKRGIRYIVMNVISFCGQPFDSFECLAGVMNRKDATKGKFYEAKTVQQKFDVTGESKYNMPLALDLETNEILWMDIALSAQTYSNVEGCGTAVTDMARVVNTMLDTRPTVYDLVSLHMMARADRIVFTKQDDVEYDLVLDESFALQIDDILANWM